MKVLVSVPDTTVAGRVIVEWTTVVAPLLAGEDSPVIEGAGAEDEPDPMADASCCAPPLPPACAEAAFSEEVAAWLALAGTAEEAPEQLKS